MTRDVALELQNVGLGLGANKTHWSLYPSKLEETLRVDEEQIPWELVLVFVGMSLDLSDDPGQPFVTEWPEEQWQRRIGLRFFMAQWMKFG